MSKRKIISLICITLLIPIVIMVGITIFKDRNYSLISIIIVSLSCIPFFIKFEFGRNSIREMTAIAVMVTMSVVGRSVFAMIPGFKPVTAIVVICGIYFGSEAGFLTGSLSAVISNMFFGQGPWTPFQMFVWGIIGFIAGLLGKKVVNWWGLILIGIFSGIMFSLIMDIWYVLSFDGTFNWTRYLAAILTSIQFMIIYIISNIVFLLALTKPIGKKLERLKVKYGIFESK